MSEAVSHDEIIRGVLASQQHRPGALLPILHRIQDSLGYIPTDSIPAIAKALNLSRAEVHGVVSFYHYFRSSPPGKHIIRLCRAEACQAMGAEHLVSHAQATLQTEIHETTADGSFTLESVYCLGNCACSPAMMIDNELYGRMTPDRFDFIVRQLKTEAQ